MGQMYVRGSRLRARNPQRLVDLGRISQTDADEVQSEFRSLEQNSGAVMVTPLVVEIIAEKIH